MNTRQIPLTPAKAQAFRHLEAELRAAQDRLALVFSYAAADEAPEGVQYGGVSETPEGPVLLVVVPGAPNA